MKNGMSPIEALPLKYDAILHNEPAIMVERVVAA